MTEIQEKDMGSCLLTTIRVLCLGAAGLLILALLASIVLGPINPSIKMARQAASTQAARTIQLAMFQYAVDNNGTYPKGKTSTEVFKN